MAAIKTVEAIVTQVPIEKPTRISTRVLGHRDYLIVRVTDTDGVVGQGYTYSGTNGGTVLREIVDAVFTPVLLGQDAEAVTQAWEQLYQECLLIGRRGAAIRALSAVDIALWDLKSRKYGAPLAVLLGGSLDPVSAYASGGYYRPDDGDWADAVSREIETNISAGFTDHKIKVGGLTVAEDAARVAAAMGVMNGTGRLALDANNAYRSVAEARDALRAFEDATAGHGLWWFEEPFSPDNVAAHAELRLSSETAIATGEIHQTRWDFIDMFKRRAVDVVQADVGVLGGVTEWLRVAHTAESYDVGIAPHWHANLHAVLSAATPGCFTVEHFLLEKDIYNFERLVTPETRQGFSDGALTFMDIPGLGFEFDDAAIQRFRI
ncbi:MAG: mandelate racemase/muconate lactonizing enzyme family protein [Mycobacterium sp.]